MRKPREEERKKEREKKQRADPGGCEKEAKEGRKEEAVSLEYVPTAVPLSPEAKDASLSIERDSDVFSRRSS